MFEIPKLQVPEPLKVASLSIKDIRAMSDEELNLVLTGEKDLGGLVPIPLQQAILSEILARNIKRGSTPHWSIVPTFWLVLISVLIAIVTLVVTVIGLPQVQNYLSTSSVTNSSKPVESTKALSKKP